MTEEKSKKMKTVKKNVDASGNDLDLVKKIDELAIKTENYVCSIHDKKFNEHDDDELIEDGSLSNLRYQKSQGHLYYTSEIKPNEISTLKEMADLGISNYDLQAGVSASCRRDFNSFLDFNGHMTTILMGIIDEISQKPIPDKLKWIAILIATKNSRLLSNCVNLTCDGYYESAMVLIRPAMENYLLLEYLIDHKELVDDFYNMKIKFSSTKLINHSKKKNKIFGSLWGILCENYMHSNIVSLHTITQSTKDSKSSILHMLPFYDKQHTRENLEYAMLFKLLTITPVSSLFVDELKNGGSVLQDILTFGKVFVEIIKNPKLQIEFSRGDKRNF